MAESVRTQSQPSRLNQPEVKFRVDDFDFLVFDKGTEVILESAISCPCHSKNGGGALTNCQNCGGSGWLFINPIETRMVLQSIDAKTMYKSWSKEEPGSIMITSRTGDELHYMDRLTLQKVEEVTKQVLFPKTEDVTNKLFSFTIYDINSILDMFMFVANDQPLQKLAETTDYTFDTNKIIFNDSFKTVDNLSITVRYKNYIQYHITKLLKEQRKSYIFDTKGRDKIGNLPIHAIAQKTHYVLSAENFTGTRIINNSYL